MQRTVKGTFINYLTSTVVDGEVKTYTEKRYYPYDEKKALKQFKKEIKNVIILNCELCIRVYEMDDDTFFTMANIREEK